MICMCIYIMSDWREVGYRVGDCVCLYIYIYILVGGFNPSEKILVSWCDYSHILWKIYIMFQTTNQYIIYIYSAIIIQHHPSASIVASCLETPQMGEKKNRGETSVGNSRVAHR